MYTAIVHLFGPSFVQKGILHQRLCVVRWWGKGGKVIMLISEYYTNTLIIAKPDSWIQRTYPDFEGVANALEAAAKPYCSVKRVSAHDIWMRDFCPIFKWLT